MLKIDVAICDGPGAVPGAVPRSVNEDAIGYHGNAAWVIDGATGIGGALLEAPSDAAWLAQTASRLIGDALAEDPERPTVDLLRAVMTGCRTALAREQVRPAEGSHELPSAAFAMVRILDGVAEITTLADCRVVAIDEAGEPRLFGSSALDAIESRTLAAARAIRLREPAIDPDALKAQLLPRLRANRALMNRDGGYWVLGTDPAAAEHAWQTTIAVRPGQRLAIASDGFLRLVELFGTATPADLLAITDPARGADWLARLRRLEAEPDSLLSHVRVKRHDDASLIVCTWEDMR